MELVSTKSNFRENSVNVENKMPFVRVTFYFIFVMKLVSIKGTFREISVNVGNKMPLVRVTYYFHGIITSGIYFQLFTCTCIHTRTR